MTIYNMFNNIISKWRNFISEAKVEEQPPEEKPARVPRPSAGVLLYKKDGENILVYLVHEGGPHNENNRYAWGIPKGRIEKGEDIQETAIREFEEEMGIALPNDISFSLGSITTRSGRVIHGFACEGDLPEGFKPKANMFSMYWHGQHMTIPEIDDGKWFSVEEAKNIINPKQYPFVDRLEKKVEQPDYL